MLSPVVSLGARRWVAAVLCTLPCVGVRALVAQVQSGDSSPSTFASRPELEAQAREAEAKHRTGEAWLLRTRLKDGDFQEGDRIVFSLQGGNKLIGFPEAANQIDTLVVRSGKVVQFPAMADLSLDGVLRSEVSDKIANHLAKYVRSPTVHVTPLVRIGVLGHATHPGFYYVSADVLLSDLIMQAGGPSADGDLRKVTVRRGVDVIWKEEDVRTAMSDGMSLDRLNLRAGDEVDVGQTKQLSVSSIVQVAAAAVAVVIAVVRFR